MTGPSIDKPTGALPRRLGTDLLWAGGCIKVPFQGRMVHAHSNLYVVRGSEKSMMIDTGHPMDWSGVRDNVENFLEGRPLDYIFPTHSELPHAGLLSHWMRKYPSAIAIGGMEDYPLYYPDLVGRMRNVSAGQSVSLGDRNFVFLPAIWKDLSHSLWGFDTGSRTLFVSDAFAFLHEHEDGECDRLSSEHPLPKLDMIRFFNERALFWTRYTDTTRGADDMDLMIEKLNPRFIAPGHGNVVDSARVLPLVKEGMEV